MREYYIIATDELMERGIDGEGLSKIVDFTGYEDIRAELKQCGYPEYKLTDEVLNGIRMFLWRKENPRRAREIIEFLESENAIERLLE